MKSHLAPCLGIILTLATAHLAVANTVWLDELKLSNTTQGWGEPNKNQSVEGHPLSIGGETFKRGLGTHAVSTLKINLGGHAQSFSARVGVDAEVKDHPVASVEFFVIGDGKTLWQSGLMKADSPAKPVQVDLAGIKSLVLQVSDGGDGIEFDHADWADAQFEMTSGRPSTVSAEPEMATVAPYILTPPAPSTPRINGATVSGVRPGSPFLYTIAATGDRPMKFSAKHLPRGLTLDAKTGIITGQLTKRGKYPVLLIAKNAQGSTENTLTIICGDQISLTPPMGWNSWNCFAHAVSAEKVKRAADALVTSGLINHGWTYINIDDFWQNHRDSKDPSLQGTFRDTNGNIVPNSRFPDMKELADYIHQHGLKAGLYSSPGPWTCGGCVGSFDHEFQDATMYARWGFDYLKYDWCSYEPSMEALRGNTTNYPAAAKSWNGKTGHSHDDLIKPYEIMHQALAAQPRDITFSLCQYGMGNVWEWGDQVGGNCWRTTGDIVDTWKSMSGIGFNQDHAAAHARPGNWNDPDMLIVGEVGWGNLHPTRLTPDEQYTHISLWCLLSAPLLIGCDLDKLDAFTLNLLCNDEVIALDQDPLGHQATCVHKTGQLRVYAKELADGTRAVGFFNLGTAELKLDFNSFADLHLADRQAARDLWRQQDVATVDTAHDSLPLTIPPHGVVLYKFTPAK
jgi:alpha-galactosidase